MGIYVAVWVVIGLAMVVVNQVKYKGLPVEVWKPGAAWTRSLRYFAFCNIVSAATGTLGKILDQPIATAEQLANPWWIAYCSFCFVYIFVAYWILWSRMTLTFDRKFHLGSEIVFGIVWGVSVGQLLLSFYHVWTLTGVPGWAAFLLGYACMGFWQYAIHDYWWDVYISPEHDSPRSIIIKTAVCHIPNVAICLGFVVLYDNYLIYVAMQAFALVAASIFQKFPAPWAKGPFHAPMTQSGLFGLPHGTGYRPQEETGADIEASPKMPSGACAPRFSQG